MVSVVFSVRFRDCNWRKNLFKPILKAYDSKLQPRYFLERLHRFSTWWDLIVPLNRPAIIPTGSLKAETVRRLHLLAWGEGVIDNHTRGRHCYEDSLSRGQLTSDNFTMVIWSEVRCFSKTIWIDCFQFNSRFGPRVDHCSRTARI